MLPIILAGSTVIALAAIEIISKFKLLEGTETRQRQLDSLGWKRTPRDISSAKAFLPPFSKRVMAGLVTIAVLGSSLYMILSGAYDESSTKWAYGSVGTIVGYWLHV